MTDEIKQTATDTTDTGATPPAEGAGAPEPKHDDLDALLAQYNKETGSPGTPAAPAPAPAAPAADADLRAEIEALKAHVTRTTVEQELDELAKGVRSAGDLPEYLSDDDIIGILERRSQREPALTKAWNDTRGNPKARAKLIRAIGEEMGKKFAKARGVDENATADREAVAASVRGSATKAPEGKAPDYSSLSDNEFRKEAAKYGITF